MRLILVATPAVCLISAVAVSATLKNLAVLLREKAPVYTSTKITAKQKASAKVMLIISLDLKIFFAEAWFTKYCVISCWFRSVLGR